MREYLEYAVLEGEVAGQWYVIVRNRYDDLSWRIRSTVSDEETAKMTVKGFKGEIDNGY